jgi:peptidoglycan hydrolase-like protein with peptidoglycan-binding domain
MNIRRTTRCLAVTGITVLVVLAASAGSGGSEPPTARPPGTEITVTTTVPEPPSTTTTSTTTTAPPSSTPPTTTPSAQRDSKAAELAGLQQQLADLGYDVGPVDGVDGTRTSFAIMAFQKVEGLPRTGMATSDVIAALDGASPPAPIVPDGEPTRIEIDLERQVLLSWRNGRLARILPTSTGNGAEYCDDNGDCAVAVTPLGRYEIGRTFDGTEVGPLGPLYYPMYFNGGIAIHGSPYVPSYPDSHGCARIPMYAAASFFSEVAPGTPVYVI